MNTVDIDLEWNAKGYETFLRIKSLPRYEFKGSMARIPKEYAHMVGYGKPDKLESYEAPRWAFDYQRDISSLAIEKQKFACFVDCGLGKTVLLLEFARHVSQSIGKKVLIVSPLMVIGQTISEAQRFYKGTLPIKQLRAPTLQAWMDDDAIDVGITNYESIREGLSTGNLGGMILDESSMLKSMYGTWGQRLIDLGKGLQWKLCLTGTPAPNDRIEYGNHAVFLDRVPTLNAFLAKYFVNRGMTGERWEIKPHAIRPFYRDLSDWSIFLSNPAAYGWKDNSKPLPPIYTHIHDVPMTDEQTDAVRSQTGSLFACDLGGIVSRQKMAGIAKGKGGIETRKPAYIKSLVDSWPEESTLIWCQHNDEQDRMADTFPDAANIDGSTPEDRRQVLVDEFKSGKRKVMISKGKILGFGLNLQIATRQVFSGLNDSYETYYQCVKRSNRTGSKLPLNVHIPVTDIERPILENVLRKASCVEADTKEQEAIFLKERVK